MISGGEVSATVGVPFAYQVQANGLPPPSSYGAANLPQGLSISAGSGLISGTPQVSGSFQVTVSAANLRGTASAVLVLNVATAPQEISFAALGDRVFGSGPVVLDASASSGLPVSFVASGPAFVSGNTLTINGAGTVTVTAMQAGNANFQAAAPIVRSFNVSKAAAQVLISAPMATNNGRPRAATVQTIPAGLDVRIRYNGQVEAPSDVGSYTVTAMVEDANYEGSASATLVIGYRLKVSEGVEPGSGIYAMGTELTLTLAIPEGRVFNRWVGDVPPGQELAYPLPVTMDRDRSIYGLSIANSGGPSAILLDRAWVPDGAAAGTVVGLFTTVDPDAEDSFRYALVEGEGGQSNPLFTISGNELHVAGPLDFDSQRTHSIRVQATDSGGLTVESAFTIRLIDSTPRAAFRFKAGFTEAPNYVNVLFQLIDEGGRGIDIPQELFDTGVHAFEVRENESEHPLARTEGFLQVSKLEGVPATVRTVILIDNSASTASQLVAIRDAAAALVSGILPYEEIAVCTFSGTLQVLEDFTNDQEALLAAIAGIRIGQATTDLYRSITTALDFWQESFTMNGIETGVLFVLTDGRDEIGGPGSDIVSKRDSEEKVIFVVGLGDQIDSAALTEIGNGGFRPVEAIDVLPAALLDARQSILDHLNSIYWVNYASPKRGDFENPARVSLAGNDLTLDVSFNSDGFTDETRRLVINRTVYNTAGLEGTVELDPFESFTLNGFVIYELVPSQFEWTLDDPTLARLVPQTGNGSQVTLLPMGYTGTATLTVRDVANVAIAEMYDIGVAPAVFVTTLTVVFGDGEPSTADPWPTAIRYGEWRFSGWFGWFYDGVFPYVWSTEHGWLYTYTPAAEDSGIYFLTYDGMGWLWTNAAYYPWIYVVAPVDEWLWYGTGGSHGDRWFYRHSDGLWHQEADLLDIYSAL